MCGIIGVVAKSPVNQLLYDGLLVLQHRGQDAAGIVTADDSTFHMHKGSGLVRDVFRTRNMRALMGTTGIAHCRYPTAGSAENSAEVAAAVRQLAVRHRARAQRQSHQFRAAQARAVPPGSAAREYQLRLGGAAQRAGARAAGRVRVRMRSTPATIFQAVSGVHRRCRGAYAVVAMIAGYGLLAFRDPYGIRPLVIGCARDRRGQGISGRLRERRARRTGLQAGARCGAGRGDLHRRGRQLLQPTVRAQSRRSTHASSSSSISRGPTR